MLKSKSFAFALVTAFAVGCYVPPEPTTAAEEQALPEDGCGAGRKLGDETQVCRRNGVWSGGVIRAKDAKCVGDHTLVCTYEAEGTCSWSEAMKDKNSCVSGSPNCPDPGPLVYKDTVTVDIPLEGQIGDNIKICDPPLPLEQLKNKCIELTPPGYDEPMKKSCRDQKDVQSEEIECCVKKVPPPPPQCLEDEMLVCNLDGSCTCVAQSPASL